MIGDTRPPVGRWLGALLFALGSALLLWRFAVGVGTWGDEPYAVTTAVRFALGDRPLIDSWDTNFSSAVMTLPFVKAWLATVGSADGIILGYRGLQLAVTSLTAWIGYHALRAAGATGKTGAAMAALIMAYMPFLSPVVGYGMDCHWHMIAGFSALLQYHNPPKRRWLQILPGVASMLGIIGNPPTVVVVPFFVVALLLAHRRDRTGGQRAAILYLAGAGGLGVAFLGVLRLLSGPEMFSMLPQITNPDDHDFSMRAHLGRLMSSTSILLLPFMLGIAVGVAARLRRYRNAFGVAMLAVSLSIPASYALFALGRLTLTALPQALTYTAAVAAIVAGLTAGVRLERGALLLVLPAAGAGIGWLLGSNAGPHTAMLAAPMALAAVLCTPGESSVEPEPSSTVRSASLIALAVAVAVPGVLYTPEGTTLSMTTVVKDGPFAGMFGTPQEAADQQRMVTALTSLPPIDGRVIFFERFPLGYLITAEQPATYSTWATSATSERLQEYTNRTGNVPERIVLTRYALDIRDGEFPDGVNLDGFNSEFTRVHADDDFIVYDRTEIAR